jgi:hypothetical protein
LSWSSVVRPLPDAGAPAEKMAIAMGSLAV